jgi:hypothetical protein
MFDFPNSPTVGQVVTGGNGAAYQWDGVKWDASSAITGAAANNVGRNLIHNGLFNIAQRGGGPFTGPYGFSLDRWNIAGVGGTISVAQTAAGDFDRSSIGDEAVSYIITCAGVGGSAAGNATLLEHHIEDLRRVTGKTVTLSFWARVISGPATSKLGINVYLDFGSGGSAQIHITPAQSITLASGWARYVTTWNIPSAAGKTFGTGGNNFLGLQLWLSSADNFAGIGVQSYTLGLWGVQLEIGNVATPLEKPDPQVDLANCQRFYEIGIFFLGGNSVVSIGNGYVQPFLVNKRANPTMTTSGTTVVNVTGQALSNPTPYGFTVYASVVANGGYQWAGSFAASADL